MRKKNYICTENSSVQITDKLSKIQDYCPLYSRILFASLQQGTKRKILGAIISCD